MKALLCALSMSFLCITAFAQALTTATTQPADRIAAEMDRRGRDEHHRRDSDACMTLARRRALFQAQENETWFNEASDRERQLVVLGDDCYQKKQFRAAKDYYRQAVAIVYPQWIFTDSAILHIKTDTGWLTEENIKTAFLRKMFSLATPFTQIALTRLVTIDKVADEYALTEAHIAADKTFDSGALVKAYGDYGDVLDMARRMVGDEAARQCAADVTARREQIFAGASNLLDAIEAALGTGKPDTAFDALDDFTETYGEFATSAVLRNRYRDLTARPEIRQEQDERDTVRLISLGDAAIQRQDYRSARRWYRLGVVKHSKAPSSVHADAKLQAMDQDADIVAAIKGQEAEIECKALLARARMLAANGAVEEARAGYDAIIAKYPESPWAQQAADAKNALPVPPKPVEAGQ